MIGRELLVSNNKGNNNCKYAIRNFHIHEFGYHAVTCCSQTRIFFFMCQLSQKLMLVVIRCSGNFQSLVEDLDENSLREVVLQVLRRQLGMIFDFMEAAPVTEAHQPGPAVPTRSPQWCTCANCGDGSRCANCGDGSRFGKECCQCQSRNCVSQTTVSTKQDSSNEVVHATSSCTCTLKPHKTFVPLPTLPTKCTYNSQCFSTSGTASYINNACLFAGNGPFSTRSHGARFSKPILGRPICPETRGH